MKLQVLEPTAAPGWMWTGRLQLDIMEESPSLGSYSSVHASSHGGSLVSQHNLNFTSEVFWWLAH